MIRAGLREKWRQEVIRSSLISDSVRVVLLVLADSMTSAGYVSVPRTELARRINRSPRRVTERIDRAREAGFLDAVRRGQPGRTAEYVATIPRQSDGAPVRTKQDRSQDQHMVRIAAPIHGADGRTKQMPAHGADGGPTNTRALRPATRKRHDHERDLRVLRDHVVEQDGTEERAPANSLVAALSPSSGRRVACAGLRPRREVAA